MVQLTGDVHADPDGSWRDWKPPDRLPPLPHRYNVLGHAKFVGVLLGGFLFFGDPLTPRVLLGLGFTCCGLWTFSYCKLYPPKQKVDAEPV